MMLRCRSGLRSLEYQQWSKIYVCLPRPARALICVRLTEIGHLNVDCSPTVTGLIRTPSSRCALAASSASLACRTFLPHRVLTNVVRPEKKTNEWVAPCAVGGLGILASSTCAADHQAELYTLLHILLSSHPLYKA
jgi:hypothetical protein